MLDINFQKYILINTNNLNYFGGTKMTKIDIISGFLGCLLYTSDAADEL